MSSYFCISFQFLDSAFHGFRDRGKNEWPPSPLRVFQSLVAAAAALQRLQDASPALTWLENQAAPIVIAPIPLSTSEKAPGYCLSVPNNAMDIIARAWCRGNYSNSGDANPSTHRTMKTVRPILLPADASVYYLWNISNNITEDIRDYLEELSDTAQSIVALGWGVDMVVGHSEIITSEQANTIQGERWYPSINAIADGLRMPKNGTLSALIQRHECFLKRLNSNGFTSPPPLTEFDKVAYQLIADPQPREVSAFSLLKPDASSYRVFDTTRMTLEVSGMMRHATSLAARDAGWSRFDINAFILGHGETDNGEKHIPVGPRRFAYIPLPSIESRGESNARVVSSIRRILITSFGNTEESKISWARRALSGHELIEKTNKESVALLSPIPTNDKVVQYYVKPATSWSTVTPVILPGYDDPAHFRRRLKQDICAEEQKRLLTRLDHRIDGLLRKAINQAGFSKDLADNAVLEWRKVGFWAGSELADRYHVPKHIERFSRYHVRLQWHDVNKKPIKVSGPVCIGGGRFYGLGLFAADGE